MADAKISELTLGTPTDTDIIPFVDLNTGITKKAVKTDLKGSDGADGADGTDGVSFTWKGAYSAETTYAVNDAVSYSGSSYMCKLESTGNLPTNTTYWDLMAQKGSDGAGSGDVLGPATNTDSYIPQWDGVNSKTLKDGIALTSLVEKSLFDANTILAANSDNTPVAVTVAEQKIIGRATGGNITALDIDSDLSSVSANDDTVPSAKATKSALDAKLSLAGGTMTGDIQLGETDIKLDATLSGDEKWSGIVIAGTAGATLAVGDVCYLASSGKWLLNDGILDGTDTGFSKQLGICVLAGADTEPTEMLVYGKVRSAAFPAFTIGSPVYLDDTAGDLTVTQPSTANFAIRIVGFAITAEDLFFNPSNDYIIHS